MLIPRFRHCVRNRCGRVHENHAPASEYAAQAALRLNRLRQVDGCRVMRGGIVVAARGRAAGVGGLRDERRMG
jgi:hypothetical protein